MAPEIDQHKVDEALFSHLYRKLDLRFKDPKKQYVYILHPKEIEIVNGPGELSLACAVLRGDEVTFTVSTWRIRGATDPNCRVLAHANPDNSHPIECGIKPDNLIAIVSSGMLSFVDNTTAGSGEHDKEFEEATSWVEGTFLPKKRKGIVRVVLRVTPPEKQ